MIKVGFCLSLGHRAAAVLVVVGFHAELPQVPFLPLVSFQLALFPPHSALFPFNRSFMFFVCVEVCAQVRAADG